MSAGSEPLRVLVVDDHDVVHWGFRDLLNKKPWIESTFSASAAHEALELVERYQPDVALVDLFLGDYAGTDLAEAIRERSPDTRVLLMSGAGRVSAHAARTAGASGFVSKEWNAEDIATAVRMVGSGMTVFAPQSKQATEHLSQRERDVLGLIAVGATNREIAGRLFLSQHTVKQHTRSVYKKLKARNRAEAVHRAQRLGLID